MIGLVVKTEITIRSSAAEYLTFVASTGDSEGSIEMRYEDENIWLTQKMMAVLYDVEIPTINYLIKKVFANSEFWTMQDGLFISEYDKYLIEIEEPAQKTADTDV
jgi:hypothetical protein